MASDNRLIFLEPNCPGREIPNTEDFSIFVELKSTSKSRSTATEGSGISNETGGKTIGFIDGTNVGGGRRSLTTNYTEIGTTFGKERDLETLGIESIDITFDTAYTPIIKIKFIDIRGNSVLEKGIDSRYKMFFELPFPLFELTVQGFYGKAVTYCLHLTKWNASFNSTSGNFEIDTEFIGYTYALLTDCLLGYMRATVLTDIGKAKFAEYLNMKDENGNKKYPGLMTIDKFLGYVNTINESFLKIKQDNDVIKQLNSLSDLTEEIDLIEKNIDNLKKPGLSEFGDKLVDKSKMISLFDKNGKNNILPIKKIEQRIKDYKDTQKKDVKLINKNIEIDLLKINQKEIINIKNANVKHTKEECKITVVDGVEYTDEANNILKDEINFKHEITDSSGEDFYLIDLTFCYEEINRVTKEIAKRKEFLDKKLSELVKNKISTFSFKPTIKNIVNIFCIHAQVFLETIEEVSKNAQANSERSKILIKLTNETDDNKPVYPWLEYKKKSKGSNGSVFESWIGGDLGGTEYDKVNEVNFVEDLLSQLMKIARQDELRELTGFGDTPIFIPVSPAEAKIKGVATKSLVKSNPYAQALKNNTPQEAIRCLLFRIFTYAGITNRLPLTGLSQHLSKFLGQAEAETLYAHINTFSSLKKRELLNSINNIASGGSKDGANKVISTWEKGGSIQGVEHPDQNSSNPGRFFKEDSTKTKYIYTYITGSTGNNQVTSYIPINNGFDGKDFFKNGTGSIKTTTELKKLSKELIFTSNYFNNPESIKKDDGSSYFRILFDGNNRDLYNNGRRPLIDSPSFTEYLDYVSSDSVLTEATSSDNLKKATYEDKDLVNGDKLNRYNGQYKTLQIDEIIYKTKSDIGQKEERGQVFKSYYYQDKDANTINITPIFGTYLATNLKLIKYEELISNNPSFSLKNVNALNPQALSEVAIKSISKFNISPEDISYVNLFTSTIKGTSQPNIITDFATNHPTSKHFVVFRPNYFGQQRQLLDKYLNKDFENELEKLYVPFVDFHVTGDGVSYGESNSSLSLFGSLFYYEQKEDNLDGDVGKAFLFLHSIAWEGIVGKIKDNVSLFELFDISDDGDDDETSTIKGLYGNAGSFIQAPVLWCAFIGALLYRYDKKEIDNVDIINFKSSNKDDSKYILPYQTEKSYLPGHDEYLRCSGYVSTAGIYLDLEKEDSDDYGKVDKVILDLPKQVREEFKRIFKNFVKNEFEDIQDYYELFKDVKDLKNKWKSLSEKVGIGSYDNNGTVNDFKTKASVSPVQGPPEELDVFMLTWAEGKGLQDLNQNLHIMIKKEDIKNGFNDNNKLENYFNISPINDNDWAEREKISPGVYKTPIGKNLYQFDLSFNDNKINDNYLTSLFLSNCYVMNANPRVFRPREDYEISVTKGTLQQTIINFFKRFSELVKDEEKDDDRIQQRIFNNVDDDIIKLNIYRTLSSINDKWLGGKINDDCANIRNIVDTFKFLDSGFINIGDDFLINPSSLQKKIIGNYNQSFFTLINGLLIENNFNFIPLPSYIEFNNAEDMYNNIFKPIPFKSDVTKTSVKPAFICVYTGQKSSNLDLGKDSEHKDDGVFISKEVNSGCGKESAPLIIPDVFETKDNETGAFIPYFLVSYGKGNQSIFKDIKLDQREFTETAESLEIIEDLSNDGDKSKVTYQGQNLFNVYQKRAYSAEVEVMGNATIQPMMYFQLNNIPMFKGAYLIYNTTHSITAHSMKTTFKGSRIKNIKTPLIDEVQLFKTLIGPITSVGSADKITNKKLSAKSKSAERLSKFIDTPLNVNIIPIDPSRETEADGGEPVGLVKQYSKNTIYQYGIREVIETIQRIAKDFYEENNRNIYYNDLSVLNGGDIPHHHTHEIGLDIDIRPIAKKDGDVGINISSTEGSKFYDKELTKKLIQKFVDAVYYDADNKPTNQKVLNIIYFNDEGLIKEFSGKVKKLDGHSNHLHISFNEPERVTKDIRENTSDDPSQNVNSRRFNN